jgi:hypothetical protein
MVVVDAGHGNAVVDLARAKSRSFSPGWLLDPSVLSAREAPCRRTEFPLINSQYATDATDTARQHEPSRIASAQILARSLCYGFSLDQKPDSSSWNRHCHPLPLHADLDARNLELNSTDGAGRDSGASASKATAFPAPLFLSSHLARLSEGQELGKEKPREVC